MFANLITGGTGKKDGGTDNREHFALLFIIIVLYFSIRSRCLWILCIIMNVNRTRKM